MAWAEYASFDVYKRTALRLLRGLLVGGCAYHFVPSARC